ncbi:MAG TPA: RHS repeat-associated core domain-containing protein [Gemmataceae bacterium]|jgi:hypothetical protein
MYDPTTGRWLTEDPSGFDAGDANLYRYAANDPTNAIDPTGLKVWPTTSEEGANKEFGSPPDRVGSSARWRFLRHGRVDFTLSNYVAVPSVATLSDRTAVIIADAGATLVNPNDPGKSKKGVFIGYHGPRAKDVQWVQFYTVQAWLYGPGLGKYGVQQQDFTQATTPKEGAAGRAEIPVSTKSNPKWSLDGGADTGAYLAVGTGAATDEMSWMFDNPEAASKIVGQLAKSYNNSPATGARVEVTFDTYAVLNGSVFARVTWTDKASWDHKRTTHLLYPDEDQSIFSGDIYGINYVGNDLGSRSTHDKQERAMSEVPHPLFNHF